MTSQMSNDVYRLPTIIPLPLPEKQLKDIVEKAKDWALMHGVSMRSKQQFSTDSIQFAPFILLPSAFPRKEFNKAVDLQNILNELMHKVAHNREFLTKSLQETIKVDDFTRKLFKIYETVEDEGVTQPISLGLVRSDYMLHTTNNTIKQVEINTVASSFGGISTNISLFNRYILEELGYSNLVKNLPDNSALYGLCQGMIDAWKFYKQQEAVILFIIEDITYNICDQRFHEFEIRKLCPKVRVIRRTLTEIAERASLGPNKELLIDDLEVAVIYFRAGYEPGHYPTSKEWDARLLMERSQAIKCPSIQYHLAGTKKVQQSLAQYGAVELFIPELSKAESVKEIFTGLYSLDRTEIGDRAIQMALEDPERFVLKPQREGGGNNIYGKEIRDTILRMKDTDERLAWILMERIQPPLSSGYMIRPGGSALPELVDLISELGIFGVIIGDSKNIVVNKQVGHMLRTKVSTANEGGVAAGLGALDSPYLIDC